MKNQEWNGVELLILQSTPFCNLDCTYCYLPNRRDTSRMSIATATAALSGVLEEGLNGDELTIVWHAGEPMAVPVSYYEEMFTALADVASEYPELTLTHSFQTNATLITDSWIDFFFRWDVRLGLSLDGPREAHDKVRVRRNGTGSFDAAIKGVENLQARGLDFHVICVVTQETVSQADALYDFFDRIEVQRLGFNFEEQEGLNESTGWQDGDGGVSKFLSRFMSRAYSTTPPMEVREMSSVMPWLASSKPVAAIRNQENTPFSILSVAVNGDVATFSPELLGMKDEKYSDFVIGNVNTQSFEEMLQSPALSRMTQEIADGIAACQSSCAYFAACGGGSPGNKYFENGAFDSTETMYCHNSVQSVIDVVLGLLESDLSFVQGQTS